MNEIAGKKSVEFSQLEATIQTGGPFDISVLGMLRFATQKGMVTYAIGSSDPKFLGRWKEISSFPVDPAATAAAKSPEFELMKSLFMTLEPLLKANGFTVDPKSVILQEGEQLGDWGKISSEHCLRLLVGTPAGDLNFEIPLFNNEFVKERTLELYGFKDSARILVVDDSLTARKSSRNCLAMAGYFQLDEAADGQLGLNKVMGSNPRFDLVVADWHMPNMSGLEMLKKIRAIPEFKKLPVILVTGEKNKEEVISAIREGVTAYLVKPVGLPDFLKALKKAGGRA
jgi:two-component system chemotaxis response regulator CheY